MKRAAAEARSRGSPSRAWWRSGLLLKFLLILGPLFLVTAVPGVWFLVEYQLRDDQELLAARIGNRAARTATALARPGMTTDSRIAQDVISMLAVDRAFLCAELVPDGGGKRLLSHPPVIGCDHAGMQYELRLPVGETPPTSLVLRYTDRELRQSDELHRSVAMSVIVLGFVLAVIASAIGFRFIVGAPLRSLLAAIRHSAETGERRAIVTDRRDELGRIITAFNEMIERENAREHKLTEVNARLSRSEIELTGLNEALETRVRDRTAELEREKLRAESANQTKSRFLAAMSHELRTPLNAIIGFSEIMKQQSFGALGSPRYAEFAQDINSSGEHLLQIINNILDISKIEAGSETLTEQHVPIGELTDACTRIMRPICDAAGVALHCPAAPAGLAMNADRTKLKQILINLLGNAAKFTPEGGSVSLTVVTGEDGGVVFTVADTGIGMKPDDIPVALAAFGQVDNSHARRAEGTGLGLPLTKLLTELHGGSFEIASAPGDGTTVTIRMPPSRTVPAKVAAA